MSAHEWTEAELSQDAQAILVYARRWGSPFTRMEIVDVAPGAAWDPMSRYPRTTAKLDPIHELVRAGLIEVAEERVSNGGRRGGHAYKVYRLTDGPRSLADLLDAMLLGGELLTRVVDDEADLIAAARQEILERFGPPR
jgi:hypothetical protein